jgi:hypothetical protein
LGEHCLLDDAIQRQIWLGAHGRAPLQIIHLLRNFLKSVSAKIPGKNDLLNEN